MIYKGKYLANVAIEFEVKADDHMRPFDEMKQLFEHELTPELERIIRYEFLDDETDGCSVKVIQLQAELWKENEQND